MAWVENQEVLGRFKEAYKSKDFSTCIQLLEGLQNDEIPYFSRILSQAIHHSLIDTGNYAETVELCGKCGPKAKKEFIDDLLVRYDYFVNEMLFDEEKKWTRPFTEIGKIVFDVIVPICRDYLKGGLSWLSNFAGKLSTYRQSGINSDEDYTKFLEMLESKDFKKDAEIMKEAGGQLNPFHYYQSHYGLNEMLKMIGMESPEQAGERISKERELRKVLEAPPLII